MTRLGELDSNISIAEQGASLHLIERKLFTADASTFSFPSSGSLDGNTDEIYKIVARIHNGSASLNNYFVRPNGVTTNLASVKLAWTSAGTSSSSSAVVMELAEAAANGLCMFVAYFFAKNNPNSIATDRLCLSKGGNIGGTGFEIFSEWNETATNITSLLIVSDQTDGIGDGSTIELFKLAQS